MALLVIEGSTVLPCLLSFQNFPSHGHKTISLRPMLITIFIVDQAPTLPSHVALSRTLSQFHRLLYIQPASGFEGEGYTFHGDSILSPPWDDDILTLPSCPSLAPETSDDAPDNAASQASESSPPYSLPASLAGPGSALASGHL